MTKATYLEMIEDALYNLQDSPRAWVSRQKLQKYFIDELSIDVKDDNKCHGLFKRALETGCSNDNFIQEKQSFRLSTELWQAHIQTEAATHQPSTSPKTKTVKKETPKKTPKKAVEAKGAKAGGKGTSAPKKPKKKPAKTIKVAS